VIAAVFDKPAKSSILNMISCNGFYGCTKCEQPGESYKAPKKKSNSNNSEENSNQDFGGGGVQHIYKFDEENSKGPLRSDETYLNDLKTASASNPVKGIKGPCILNSLKHFKAISSTCIDYMHSILEGVVKNFFKYWFSSEFSYHDCSIRKYLQEIDKRLL